MVESTGCRYNGLPCYHGDVVWAFLGQYEVVHIRPSLGRRRSGLIRRLLENGVVGDMSWW